MKRGFTLIELLAVIVILAIIALIATPIVLDIIENSKNSSTLRSAEMYLDALEVSVANATLDDKKVTDGIYNILETGDICLEYDSENKCSNILEVEVNGEIPSSGTITISNGVISDIELEYQDKYIIKDEKENLVYYQPKTYKNGEVVYYNVENGTVCTEMDYDATNSNTGYNGVDDRTETQNGCMKFYAFNDLDGNKTLNLLLDHNTTGVVAWNLSGSNVLGPIEVLTALYHDTKAWEGTIIPQNYTMDQSSKTSGATYTVEYSKTPSIEEADGAYKARLITAQEVAQITGADMALNWNEKLESSDIYYLDGSKGTDTTWQTQISSSKKENIYYWLFDRTYDCQNHGCDISDLSTFGYWTVSSNPSYFDKAWDVHGYGLVHNDNVDYPNSLGVRPVITVLKYKLQR